MPRYPSSNRPEKYNDENHGPLETAVRRNIAEISLDSAMSESYAEICFNLARKLDNGAGMATAAVAKELRETLQLIEEASGDDDGSDLLNALRAPVSAPVRNAS